MKIKVLALLMVGKLLLSGEANAQSCNCSVTITQSGAYTPSNLSVPAGGTICIQAGTYTNLAFNGIQGTAAQPITIKNCSGQVIIQNTTNGTYPISFGNKSKYIKLSGKGDSNYELGIKIAGTGTNSRGVSIADKSTNIEVEGLEIQNVKGVGVWARSELGCDSTSWGNYYSMNGIKVHHNYIHDTDGTGIVAGEAYYGTGKTITCSGVAITKNTPQLYGLEIYNNKIERTGGSGISYAAAPDAKIHHNTLLRCGKLPSGTTYNHAVNLSGGAGGDFYNNTIIEAQGSAFFMLGFLGNQKFYNNLIVRPTAGVLFSDSRPGSIPDSYFLFANNTIVSPPQGGLTFYSLIHNHIVVNNVMLNSGNGQFIKVLSSSVKVTKNNNYFNGIVDASFFEDTTTFNYRPKSFTPLVNKGQDLSSWGIVSDISDAPRPNGTAFDIGCFESAASVATTNPNACDYTVVLAGDYSPNNLTAGPGNTVCIKAGNYTGFKFTDLAGSSTQPITFKNAGGLVNIQNSNTNLNGIAFLNCRYFKLTGTGDSTLTYGVKVAGTGSGGMGVKVDSKSSDCELDHLEIASTGFAGIMAKTDPNCDSTTWRGNFVMYNVKIHDNFIHDTPGEGLYIGNSFAGSGMTVTCDGTSKKVYPHTIVGLEVYNNHLERTGCEGIQYGCSTDAKVHHNTMIDTGISPFDAFQANGIQIGEGSGGDCYNNTVMNARGTGIIILGFLGNQSVYNNLVVNSGYNGIFADSRVSSIPNTYLRIVNNSIITTQSDAIKLYSLIHTHEVANNLILAPATGKFIVKLGSPVIVNEYNNFKNTQISAAMLTNVGAGNYYPTAGSPLIDTGYNVSSWNINKDRDDNNRPLGSGYDIGCFEYTPPGSN